MRLFLSEWLRVSLCGCDDESVHIIIIIIIQVISILLTKFKIVTHPRKFALFEKNAANGSMFSTHGLYVMVLGNIIVAHVNAETA